jgi:hypothetical protein
VRLEHESSRSQCNSLNFQIDWCNELIVDLPLKVNNLLLVDGDEVWEQNNIDVHLA